MRKSSTFSGHSPRCTAARSVGTSPAVMPSIAAQARSSLCALADAASAPIFLGVPCVGPFPSMPTTASQMQSRGAKYSAKSTSIPAKSSALGY